METLFKDIRYGFRGLLKRRGFTAVAVITLALGIGANTAIFTLINAVVLKQLPVSNPEELVLFNDSASEGTRVLDDDIRAGRNFTSLRIQTDEALKQDRLIAQLVSFFGLLALLLSCVGLYGIMAHAVVRRTNEIGIRMALGAERRDIIWMVLKESLLLVAFGLAVGLPASWAAAQLISNQLFGLKPSDPLTLLTAVTLLSMVAALAGYLPARKASRVDPLVALRYE